MSATSTPTPVAPVAAVAVPTALAVIPAGAVQEFKECFSVSMLSETASGNCKITPLANGRFRVRAKGQHCEVVNRNGRKYPSATTWGKHTTEDSAFIQRVKSRRVIGQLEHPESGRSSMGLAAVVITEVAPPDVTGEVFIEFETMSTVAGQVVSGFIRDGVGFGISSRGNGSVLRVEGVDVVQEDFEPVTFDLVVDESTPGAEVIAMKVREALQRATTFLMESVKGDSKKAAEIAEAQLRSALARDILSEQQPPSGDSQYLLGLDDGSAHYRGYDNGVGQWDVWFEPASVSPMKVATAMPTLKLARQAAEEHLRLVVGRGAAGAPVTARTSSGVAVESQKPLKEITSGGKVSVGVFLTILTGHLVAYDMAQSAREMRHGSANIYRLGHLLGAANEVAAAVKGVEDRDDGEAMAQLSAALQRFFTPTFAPVVKTLKQIGAWVTAQKIPNYPVQRGESKEKKPVREGFSVDVNTMKMVTLNLAREYGQRGLPPKNKAQGEISKRLGVGMEDDAVYAVMAAILGAMGYQAESAQKIVRRLKETKVAKARKAVRESYVVADGLPFTGTMLTLEFDTANEAEKAGDALADAGMNTWFDDDELVVYSDIPNPEQAVAAVRRVLVGQDITMTAEGRISLIRRGRITQEARFKMRESESGRDAPAGAGEYQPEEPTGSEIRAPGIKIGSPTAEKPWEAEDDDKDEAEDDDKKDKKEGRRVREDDMDGDDVMIDLDPDMDGDMDLPMGGDPFGMETSSSDMPMEASDDDDKEKKERARAAYESGKRAGREEARMVFFREADDDKDKADKKEAEDDKEKDEADDKKDDDKKEAEDDDKKKKDEKKGKKAEADDDKDAKKKDEARRRYNRTVREARAKLAEEGGFGPNTPIDDPEDLNHDLDTSAAPGPLAAKPKPKDPNFSGGGMTAENTISLPKRACKTCGGSAKRVAESRKPECPRCGLKPAKPVRESAAPAPRTAGKVRVPRRVAERLRYLEGELARVEAANEHLAGLVDEMAVQQEKAAVESKVSEVLRQYPELTQAQERLKKQPTAADVQAEAAALLGLLRESRKATMIAPLAETKPSPTAAALNESLKPAPRNGTHRGTSVTSARTEGAPEMLPENSSAVQFTGGALRESSSSVDDTASRVAAHRRRHRRSDQG